MTVLVNRCYDWMSFHLINELLLNGYSVTGIHDKRSELNDHLSMFVGRNSSFTEGFPENELTNFQVAIIFGDVNLFKPVQVKQLFLLNPDQQNHSLKPIEQTIIELPLLFGEWMPMNEEGMFNNDQFLSFNSNYFIENAVFIGDFCKLLLSWLQQTYLPSTIELYSSKNRKQKEIKLENSVYIHDNRPIKEKLETVRSHYSKFKHFYKYKL